MGITTDRNDPGLGKLRSDGQQESYLVLSEEERAKGFVVPLRRYTIHVTCGTATRIPAACAETYARNPAFYGGTFCCYCGKHFPLVNPDGSRAFTWEEDSTPVGEMPPA
jgi:hypothetical protein